jgi:ribosomal protein S18 acetylase RimI-like enzyme
MSSNAPGPLVYRPIRRSDSAQYIDLLLRSMGEFEQVTGLGVGAESAIRSLFRLPVWWTVKLLNAVGRPAVHVIVAASDRTIAGTGMILWTRSVAYVAGMATRPEFRGRGIASQVLALLGLQALRHGRAWLALDVESENETAIRVYLKAGYREIAEFSWFTRTGLPPASGSDPGGTRPMARSDRKSVAAALDAARPPAYRAAFPASPHLLDHNEFTMRTPRIQHRAWVKRATNGTPCVARAFFSPRTKWGTVLLRTGTPEPPAEDLTALLDAAVTWLAPFGPEHCLAPAADPPGAVTAALERAGFSRAARTKTMIRETPGSGAPARGASVGA